ncbi:SixA phosphatase family protein [Pseudosporangium ferrugineum]|uniref:Phosphohistidine phosphatase n=1 Tax=Pseudosporangium ferrugineum TaxID=439699 RepID=A0A2T0S128_9ACTN|nr:histidine phosphatase family protein [Pseudosporangium ferrugineum]PRY27110.1 phosphohistidine phosphatase [Pseudosporangium ferrugineum]
MTARTLVLLRHGKAETPDERPDFDRRLTDRGRADAAVAGAWLAAQNLRPDVVLCSPAARTRETWDAAAAALAAAAPEGPVPQVRYEDGLYAGGRTELVDLLRALPDAVSTVLVVGHNPTVSDVSVLLRPDDTGAFTEGLKTSGIAVHRMEGSWSTTEPGSMPLLTEHTARG